MTTINYNEVLIEMLEKNAITHLPSKEVISSDKRIALAVWKNFFVLGLDGRSYYKNDDCYEWYEKGDWSYNLETYQEDINFWEEALKDLETKMITLLHPPFKNDFPLIYQHYLGNDDKIFDLYYKVKSHPTYLMRSSAYANALFDLISLSTKEKDIIKKNEILTSGSASIAQIEKYQYDENFIFKLIQQSPSYYRYLNDTLKNDDEMIELALKYDENWKYLSEEKKELYFEKWFNLHKNNMRFSDFMNFSFTQQKKMLLYAPNVRFVDIFLKHDIQKYLPIAKKYLEHDAVQYLNNFTPKHIQIMLEDDDFRKKITPQIMTFINGYYNVSIPSKKEQNMIDRLLHPELIEAMNNNLFYQIYHETKDQKRCSLEQFIQAYKLCKKAYDESLITHDKAEEVMQSMKSRLEIEVLKEKKFPKKELFRWLRVEELSETLEDNNTVTSKPKI